LGGKLAIRLEAQSLLKGGDAKAEGRDPAQGKEMNGRKGNQRRSWNRARTLGKKMVTRGKKVGQAGGRKQRNRREPVRGARFQGTRRKRNAT